MQCLYRIGATSRLKVTWVAPHACENPHRQTKNRTRRITPLCRMERYPMNNHRFLPLLCAFAIIPVGCRSKSAAPVPSSTQVGPMIYELDVSNQAFHDRLLRGFYA